MELISAASLQKEVFCFLRYGAFHKSSPGAKNG